MRAVTWQGRRDMQVTDVPDPVIQHPTDAVVRITSTALCGSDLHLYDPLSAFMTPGDVVGHEPMGVVEAVGSDVSQLSVGDRVAIQPGERGDGWTIAEILPRRSRLATHPTTDMTTHSWGVPARLRRGIAARLHRRRHRRSGCRLRGGGLRAAA